MDSADARAGQHGDGRFRHHRHIDSNDIAFFNAQIEQYVGKTANIAMELAISDIFALAGVVAFPDDSGLVAALVQMAVETVGREVQGAIFIPFDGDVSRRERGIFHLCVRFDPIEDFTLLAPEGIGVADGLLVVHLVLLRIHQAMFRNLCGNRVFMYLAHGFFSPLTC